MSELRVCRHRDARAFLADTGEYLAAREAEHNLLLGLATRLTHSPRLYGHEPYLACVSRDAEIAAAALRTPPYNLLLSETDDLAALEPLAADVAEVHETLPGVLGPKEASRRFAEIWEARTGRPGRLRRAQRIFRADRVEAPTGVSGWLRRATEADRPLLVEWMAAFAEEALEGGPQSAGEVVDDRLGRGAAAVGLYVWEDSEPVSMAGAADPTPNGIRIGPVYTPPRLRGRGYASALVAALTEALLVGREFCFLFTDLANPVSNRIYERIGYRPVTDVDEWCLG